MSNMQEFMLRPDIRIVAVRELHANLRERLADDEAYALLRDHSRTPSSLIDHDTADLLRQFHEPRSLTEAVLRYSLPRRLDPRVVLNDSFEMLGTLISAKDLVPPNSLDAQPVTPSLKSGEVIAGYTVTRCLQFLTDSEVYQVYAGVQLGVLKLARDDSMFGAAAIHREIAALRRLGGVATPTLLTSGTHNSQPFFISTWVDGADSHTASSALRKLGGERSGEKLATLARHVLDSYARLHAHGVLHGDVRPANLLVTDGPEPVVTIIDLGLASIDGSQITERGGLGPFADCDYAAALLAGRQPEPVSAAAEQYSVAAVLYFLLTGDHYCDFSWDPATLLSQIVEQSPMSFVDRGLEPWPEAEYVLGRGLNKDPDHRYPTMNAFSDAFRAATAKSYRSGASQAHTTPATGVFDELLADLDFNGPALADDEIEGPTASLAYGAAGVSYGLYRLALTKESPRLIALADTWAHRAVNIIGSAAAFTNSSLEITPSTVGTVSAFHTASGVFAVSALVNRTVEDVAGVERALANFVERASQPCDKLDLTLGRSSVLLAATLLVEATRSPVITKFGGFAYESILGDLASLPPIARQDWRLAYLGVAHGWAGVLYALLRWCQATGTPVPWLVTHRLDQLAAQGQRSGRTVRWPIALSDAGSSASGWCHGSAGYVFLWTHAAQILDRPGFLGLAEWAAIDAVVARPMNSSLCCGLAGQAYALLSLYRATGDRQWLSKARSKAVEATRDARHRARHRLSLYKGQLGVAVLLADLESPTSSAMPFFESEGWSSAFNVGSGAAQITASSGNSGGPCPTDRNIGPHPPRLRD